MSVKTLDAAAAGPTWVMLCRGPGARAWGPPWNTRARRGRARPGRRVQRVGEACGSRTGAHADARQGRHRMPTRGQQGPPWTRRTHAGGGAYTCTGRGRQGDHEWRRETHKPAERCHVDRKAVRADAGTARVVDVARDLGYAPQLLEAGRRRRRHGGVRRGGGGRVIGCRAQRLPMWSTASFCDKKESNKQTATHTGTHARPIVHAV